MPQPALDIKLDKLTSPQVLDLLNQHMQLVASTSPAESVHALDAHALKQPGIKFWAAWYGSELAAVAALKTLDEVSAEIKSMHTSKSFRQLGVASKLLQHLIDDAKTNDNKTLYLETGSTREFKAARELYKKFGFTYRPPFADYVEDPNSVFMQLAL